jgi:hypothetical protein
VNRGRAAEFGPLRHISFLGKPQTTCPWSWRHGWRRASTISSTRSGKTTSEEDNHLLANGSSDPHLQGHSSRLGTGSGHDERKQWGRSVEEMGTCSGSASSRGAQLACAVRRMNLKNGDFQWKRWGPAMENQGQRSSQKRWRSGKVLTN